MAGKELDASVIDPPREEEESEPGLKEELHKLKHQMAEMYRPEYRKERQQRKQIFTPLGESYTSLFQRLTQVGILTPIESLPNPPSKNLDYSVKCVYCSNAPRHDTEKCWHLKSAIQELIDTNQIEVQSPEAPNINQNPLPAHAETHMIEIVYKDGKAEKPSKSIIMIRASESNSVKTPVATNTTSSAIEGLTDKLSQLDVKPPMLVAKWSLDDVETNQGKLKVVMPGVARKEVEEEVNETLGLTHLGRCFAPEELRKAKTLKDSPTLVKKPITEEEAEEFLRKIKVQDYTIVEQLRKIPAQISFLSLLIHLDEHRRALMKILNEAHVPDKITVNNLEKIANKIFEANRITFSDDEPPLEGPVEFTMEFQVLDMAVSYNLLLGRPWIHIAKAVPSSLHQMVKFEWDRQEIIVHVSVEKVPEGEYIPGPKLASATVMVANEMLKNGFVPVKGLGASLQGIVQPVSIRKNLGTFGLGFKPTGDDVKKAKKLKRKAWSLHKPIPRLSRSFVKSGVVNRLVSAIPKPLVDFDEELIERFQSLFDGVNMVEIGKGSCKADV
ncbi:uncharacterized protein LOC142165941 [Nicotiana tabacum]|uniref:Uncharacterized protein LOC142165941 n=1 Tax=Nicotiana tabacum TaxID=4097 RepID=A0AC58S642_TOBAC